MGSATDGEVWREDEGVEAERSDPVEADERMDGANDPYGAAYDSAIECVARFEVCGGETHCGQGWVCAYQAGPGAAGSFFTVVGAG
jgi:hypothetical protein